MSYLVASEQRKVHVFTEAVAVAIIAPLLLQLSEKKTLSRQDRSALRTMALATLAVDGWLLARWLSRKS